MTSTVRYNSVAIFLHWSIALLMVGMLAMGLLLDSFPTEWKFNVMVLHKSIGLTVLALSVFRLIWRLMNPPPPLPATMKWSEKALANLAHAGLYFLMIAMPLTGWLMVSASAKYPTLFYWLVEVPFLPLPSGADPKELRHFFGEAHEIIALGGIALIVLHVAAALYHYKVKRDGVLQRMLPQRATGANDAAF